LREIAQIRIKHPYFAGKMNYRLATDEFITLFKDLNFSRRREGAEQGIEKCPPRDFAPLREQFFL